MLGAVPLDRGKVLVCGVEHANGDPSLVSRLVVLSAAGEVVRAEEVPSPGEKENRKAGFGQCLPWNDGIAVIGYVTTDDQTQSWLVKLNMDGAVQWQSTNPMGVVAPAIATADGGLVLTNGDVQTNGAKLAHVDQDGKLLSSTELPGAYYCVLTPDHPQTRIDVLLVPTKQARERDLYVLDQSLAGPPKKTNGGPIFAERICGYIRADNSAVIFGYASGSRETPAVAWVRRHWGFNLTTVIPELEPGDYSRRVNGAAKLSDSEFVTIRDRLNLTHPDAGATILSWITLH